MRILSIVCLVLGILFSSFCMWSDPMDKWSAILVYILRYPALILIITGSILLIMGK